jgi:hypothetical protein
LYTPTNPSRDQSIRRKEKEKKESTEPSGGVRRARLACPSSTNKEQQRRQSLARSHLAAGRGLLVSSPYSAWMVGWVVPSFFFFLIIISLY